MTRLCKFAISILLSVVFVSLSFGQQQVTVFGPSQGPISFAIEKIQAAQGRDDSITVKAIADLNEKSSSLEIILVAGDASKTAFLPESVREKIAGLVPQGYIIRRVGDRIWVVGGDESGAMYGGLDIAEAIRLGTIRSTDDSIHTPYIAKRGIKFNIPLDLRTPSYSDCSDAFQANIPEMWSMDFWRSFLDAMAEHRFNVLTLWNLHPFPSIVKVPEFPDVALADVWRTKVPFDDSFSFSGSDMLRPAMLKDVEVLRRMTIDEKIAFWRQVMEYARDRGIEVYWFTWNLFTFGAEGKHGIRQSQTDETTIAYFRASVRELIKTYPLLAGIGITAGEQLDDRKDEYSRENWLWKTYGLGINDALRELHGRKFRLIHRFHMTRFDDVEKVWKDLVCPMEYSFKYSIAHMYSSVNPPFINDVLPYLSPQRRTWLTVRNDDIYSFRWADSDYARRYIQAMPGSDKLAGFYMGPDGYCWGREAMAIKPQTPRQLVIDKQWFSFLLWGRLSYEPTLTDRYLTRIMAAHYGIAESYERSFVSTWAEASQIFPTITQFFWGDIDLRWFPEACLSHPRYKGFYTVRDFIEGQAMPGSGLLSILQWRDQVVAGKTVYGNGPLDVADRLRRHADHILRMVDSLRGHDKLMFQDEYRQMLADMTAMAYLGRYYSAKIRGACDLALFDAGLVPQRRVESDKHLPRETPSYQLDATSDLMMAELCWRDYAKTYAEHYKQPILYNRVGWVDIPALTAKVRADLQMAMDWKPGTIQPDKIKQPGADQPFRK